MSKKQSSAAARTQAQNKARELREAQLKKDNRMKMLAIGMVVLVAVILIGAIAAIFLQSNKTALDADTRPGNTTEVGAITVGAGGEAGSVSSADVPVVTVFLDYACVHCETFESIYHDTLQQMATDGEITVEYRPVGALTNWSRAAARAAAVVAEQEPAKFLDAHAALFDPSSPAPGQVESYLAAVGISETTLKAVDANTYRRWVSAATEKAYEDFAEISGRNLGTPSILINGEVFNANWNFPEVLLGAIEHVAQGGTVAEYEQSLAAEAEAEGAEDEAPSTDLESEADDAESGADNEG